MPILLAKPSVKASSCLWHVAQEIEESLANWQFDVQKVRSETDPDAIILKIKEVERV